jgi:hypothetical protein
MHRNLKSKGVAFSNALRLHSIPLSAMFCLKTQTSRVRHDPLALE